MKSRHEIGLMAPFWIVLALAFASVAQTSGPGLKAHVPFPFFVGDKAMPAGDYTVQRTGQHGDAFVIRTADFRRAQIELVNSRYGRENYNFEARVPPLWRRALPFGGMGGGRRPGRTTLRRTAGNAPGAADGSHDSHRQGNPGSGGQVSSAANGCFQCFHAKGDDMNNLVWQLVTLVTALAVSPAAFAGSSTPASLTILDDAAYNVHSDGKGAVQPNVYIDHTVANGDPCDSGNVNSTGYTVFYPGMKLANGTYCNAGLPANQQRTYIFRLPYGDGSLVGGYPGPCQYLGVPQDTDSEGHPTGYCTVTSDPLGYERIILGSPFAAKPSTGQMHLALYYRGGAVRDRYRYEWKHLVTRYEHGFDYLYRRRETVPGKVWRYAAGDLFIQFAFSNERSTDAVSWQAATAAS